MPLTENGVREHLHGVAAGLLIPFNDNLGVEHDELAANATTLCDEGTRVFLASASINKYHPLTRQERVDVTTATADALPSDVCVLAGIGGSTASARELIDAYDHIGVNGMMIMPPDHTYVHERGLLHYYGELAEASTVPLVPYVKGFNPSINYLRDLTGLDGVIDIKYAVEDVVKLGAATNTTGDDVVWVDGLAESSAISFWNEGIEGFSADVGNFRPEVGLALFEALAEENQGHARELRNICLPCQNFRDQAGQNNSLDGAISVPAVKKGLKPASLRDGAVHEPIRLLSTDDERRTEELRDQFDDDIERLID